VKDQRWSEFFDERDAYVIEHSGYGGRGGFGQRSAVLVIDVTVGFCGEQREPIETSITRWRNSCGEVAWDALPVIAQVTNAARAHGVPVIYSGGMPRPNLPVYSGRWLNKNTRRDEDTRTDLSQVYEIMPQIAPEPGDIVIRKTKPSVFFGTPLLSYLINLSVDTLICCGTSTSGCVRSTVLDAFSNNLRVVVIEDATFDRVQASHCMNLFDMDQKYADVLPSDEVIGYLESLKAAPDDGNLVT
jgi:maleamate amidohydrolase